MLSAAAAARADSPAAWTNRAEELIRSGDKAGALSALSKAAEATPATAESEDRIGFLLAVLQQQTEAIAHFRKSIAIDWRYAAAHFHLGAALWLANDTRDGMEELEQAAKLAPGVFDYRYRLGAAYLQVGRYEDAATELKAATAIDRSKPPVWESLGQALQRSGDVAGALDAYREALKLDPANDAAHNNYAAMLIETRQPDLGIAESRKVLEHHPGDLGALMNIGYAHLKKGDFDAAEKAYREALTVDPKSAAAHYDLGIALKMKDQIEQAQGELKEAIRLDPGLPQAHYTLGITHWQQGNFPAALEQMHAAIAAQPDYAEAHYMLGIILKQTGDLDGAVPELKEAIRLDPTSPGPYNTLGQILRIKGDKQGSEEAFATGTRLKKEADAKLANTLDQGMRGGIMPQALPAAR